jgi:ribulose-phosphate 3-epimerase
METSDISVASASFNPMVRIIPAMLPQAYKAIELSMDKVHEYVNTVQLDLVDGHFAHNRTWLFNGKDEERLEMILKEEMGMPYWDHVNYELDLIVKNPLERMDTYIALGPSKMIFHVESLDTEKMLQWFEALPEIIRSTISFGIAINVDTDPALVAPYLPYINTVQCMGIENVGFQGQPFDERVIEQVKKVRAMYPEKIVSVDGGMTLETAPLVVSAGAHVVIVGSAVFQNIDPHGTIEAFKQVCEQAETQSENLK